MTPISKDTILNALSSVINSDTGMDVVSAGMVSSIVIRDNRIGFAIEVPENKAGNKEALRKDCENAVKAIEGVGAVTVVLTAPSRPAQQVPAPAPKQRIAHKDRPTPLPIAGVKHVLAVASGKGGVGKSTVAVNLAVALAKLGLKIGLADADIYGPSVPRMLGLKDKPEVRGNKMVAAEAHGIKAVSMGSLLPEDVATVWRGPMIAKALHQLVRGTEWGELDCLVIDMPPGTGDIHISLSQNYPLSGAVMVSTPQDIALLDVRKAISMFNKVDVPVWGVVENMSYFADPASGNKHFIFGQGGARKLAKELHLPFLAEIPIDPAIRAASDDGVPVASLPRSSVIAQAYYDLAKALKTTLAKTVEPSFPVMDS